MAKITLTLEFKELFLLVDKVKSRNKGVRKSTVVLLPRGTDPREHDAKLKLGFGGHVHLDRDDVWFIRGTTDLSGQVARRKKSYGESEFKVVNFSRVAGRLGVDVPKVKYRFVDRSVPVPEELGARIWLPAGATVTERAPVKPDAENLRWAFAKPSRQHVQRLTDRMSVTFEIDDSVPCFVVCVNAAGEIRTIKLTESRREDPIEVLNEDPPCPDKDPVMIPHLRDYALLYDLAPAPLPIPVLTDPLGAPVAKRDDTAKFPLSNCLPICGSGECDPEDPPGGKARSGRTRGRAKKRR